MGETSCMHTLRHLYLFPINASSFDLIQENRILFFIIFYSVINTTLTIFFLFLFVSFP